MTSKQKLDTGSLSCDMCSSSKKIAVKINDINVCYDCLRFVRNRSELEGNTAFTQLNIDSSYVASNADMTAFGNYNKCAKCGQGEAL